VEKSAVATPVDRKSKPDLPATPSAAALPSPQAQFASADNGAESGIDPSAVEGQLDQLIHSQSGYATAASFLEAANALMPVLNNAEALCYKSAQATTKIDPALVLESVNSFRAVLESEKQNFETNFVGASQGEIDKINSQAQGLGEQIKQLAEQLGQLNDQRAQLVASAAAKTASLGKSRIDFDMVVNKITTKYGDIAAKVQQHLGVQ
jgi:hypothetical protein